MDWQTTTRSMFALKPTRCRDASSRIAGWPSAIPPRWRCGVVSRGTSSYALSFSPLQEWRREFENFPRGIVAQLAAVADFLYEKLKHRYYTWRLEGEGNGWRAEPAALAHGSLSLRAPIGELAGGLGFWELAQSIHEQGIKTGVFSEEMMLLLIEYIKKPYEPNAQIENGIYSTGKRFLPAPPHPPNHSMQRRREFRCPRYARHELLDDPVVAPEPPGPHAARHAEPTRPRTRQCQQDAEEGYQVAEERKGQGPAQRQAWEAEKGSANALSEQVRKHSLLA